MHQEKKLYSFLLSGYTPLSERRLAGGILDALHKNVIDKYKEIFSEETLSLND